MRFLKYALVLSFLAFGWLIGWSNNIGVTFNFLGWSSPSLPVFVLYFLFLLVGLLLGLIAGRLIRRK